MIERHADPVAYERLVTPLLLRDEPRYNLELAIVHRVANGHAWSDQPPVLLTVGDGMALMTPPHNLILSAAPRGSGVALAEYVHANGIDVPGALGEPETVAEFGARYAALSGTTMHRTRDEGVYALTTLVDPRPVTGALRPANDGDGDLVVAWWLAFMVENRLRAEPPEHALSRIRDGLLWIWDDAGPVSMVGCGGYTPHGARVGPVYTPPERRSRGYASAATAAVTRLLLDRGLEYAFLYTDLANPTSNKIYRAIGYEHVTDIREVAFEQGVP